MSNLIKLNGQSLYREPTTVDIEKVDTSIINRDIEGKLVKIDGVIKRIINITGFTNTDDLSLLENMEVGLNTVSIIGYGINDSYTINFSFNYSYRNFSINNKKAIEYNAKLEEV